MPPSNDDRRPSDLARQQQCWGRLWKLLLTPLPPEVRADAAIVAYWPEERPPLDGVGELAPASMIDAGDGEVDGE